jgi:hypothetical protein
MTGTQQNDVMKNLVIFILVLAILGIIFALGWYFAVDLPLRQAVLNAPANAARQFK